MYKNAGQPIAINEPDYLSKQSRRISSLRRVALLFGFGGAACLGWYLYNLYQAGAFQRTCSKLVLKTSEEATQEERLNVPEDKMASIAGEEPDMNSNISIRAKLQDNIKVTLHQSPRGYMTPCIAPFPLKLETFLRVAGIAYEVDFSITPEDRITPWMTVGDVEMTESHECISKLQEMFDVNLASRAQNSRVIASRLVGVVLENHIYWGIALWRWVYDEGRTLPQIQPLSPSGLASVSDIGSSVSRAAWYHGLGRLSPKQVTDLILKDLGDLSVALGKHSYFLGDSAGEVDCAAFSLLAQMIWNMPGSPFESGIKQYRNLVDYVLRMRDNFWPDWQTLLQVRGQECEALAIQPGSEFLDKRQLNSDSSHWESKTNSSNVTLRDLPVKQVNRQANKELHATVISEANAGEQELIQSETNQGDGSNNPNNDFTEQPQEQLISNKAMEKSSRTSTSINQGNTSCSNGSFCSNNAEGKPGPWGVLQSNSVLYQEGSNSYFPPQGDFPQENFRRTPDAVYSKDYTLPQRDMSPGGATAYGMHPITNSHANIINKIMTRNTSIGRSQPNELPQQHYQQNEQGILQQSNGAYAYHRIQDQANASLNGVHIPHQQGPFFHNPVHGQPQYSVSQNQYHQQFASQHSQLMANSMPPQQQLHADPRMSAHHNPVPQRQMHQIHMQPQNQEVYQQRPTNQGMMPQLQPRY